MLLGWGTGTGEASSSLKALLMTFNRDRGFGTANRGRYSNGKVDALTEDALQTVDDVKRAAYLQRATEIAINDTGVIPLHSRSTCGRARWHRLSAAHRRANACPQDAAEGVGPGGEVMSRRRKAGKRR